MNIDFGQIAVFAAVAVVVIFAVRAFVLGIVRLLLGMLSLAIAAGIGYFVFVHGQEWLPSFAGGGDGSDGVGKRLAGAWGAGGAAYGGLGWLSHRAANLFQGEGSALGVSRLKGALLSLIPSGFLLSIVTAALRFTGSVTGLEETRASVSADGGTVQEGPGIVSRIREGIGTTWISGILDWIQPEASNEALALSRLAMIQKDPDAWEALQQIPEIRELLQTPEVANLLGETEVRRAIELSDPTALLEHEQVAAVANEPEVGDRLKEVDVDSAIDSVLFEPAATVSTAASPVVDNHGVESAKEVRRKYRRGPKRN